MCARSSGEIEGIKAPRLVAALAESMCCKAYKAHHMLVGAFHHSSDLFLSLFSDMCAIHYDRIGSFTQDHHLNTHPLTES